jgi:hypothetical protein
VTDKAVLDTFLGALNQVERENQQGKTFLGCENVSCGIFIGMRTKGTN